MSTPKGDGVTGEAASWHVTPRWQKVGGSTIVQALAYDEAAHRIFVRLHSGAEHVYDGCPPAVWDALCTAPSTGEFVTRSLERYRVSMPSVRESRVNRSLLLNAFQPSAETSDPDRFAGRGPQVLELTDALRVHGSVPVIYGERGLGKSSLANQVQLIAMGSCALLGHLQAEGYELAEDETFQTAYVACSREMSDVDGVLRAAINAVSNIWITESGSVPHKEVEVTRTTRVDLKVIAHEHTRRFSDPRARPESRPPALPEELIQVCASVSAATNCPILVIIDELDRLPDKRGLASVLKNISGAELKFMLVGIADDWTGLLEEHRSLERLITPVEVLPMSRPELAQIVTLADESLRLGGSPIRIGDDARTRLVDVSGGNPWFVHVLGQAGLLVADNDQQSTVTSDSITKSIRSMVTNKFSRHFARQYSHAVANSRPREIVLRAFAQSTAVEISTAEVYEVCKSLGVARPAAYKGYLTRTDAGEILVNCGPPVRAHVRFADQMFKRYVFLTPSLHEGVDQEVSRAFP